MTTDSKIETRAELARLVTELYATHTRIIKPSYPWVFVYILPKEQRIGSIFLPGKQNKPVHEGIVLRTWSSCLRDGWEHVSALKPGDHVLLPHWCGLPVPGYDELDYRIVKEESWSKDKDGGIFAVIDYESETLRATLSRITEHLYNFMTVGEVEDVKAAIEKEFTLIPRGKGSATLSGK